MLKEIKKENDVVTNQDLFNEIVAYEKKLDFATALTKVQEYIEMFPEDSAAKKERAFLKTRTSSEG